MLSMKTMVILVSLLLLAVQGMSQNLISPEQAKEAVRAFEGKPDLEFETIRLETETDLPPGLPLPQPYWYELEAKERKGVWSVNARTGEVAWVYYPEELFGPRSEKPFGPLTKEECRKIAENFARSKYAGFDQMNFKLIHEWWTGQSWEFEWAQILEYGARGLNRVNVDVNPANGRIRSYNSTRFKQGPLRQPQITEEQAVNIAKQTLKLVTVYGSEALLKGLPDGSVRWEVTIEGEVSSGDFKGGVVSVDAETGKVLRVSYYEESKLLYQRTFKRETKGMNIGFGRWQMGVVGLGLLLGVTFLVLWRWRLFRLRA